MKIKEEDIVEINSWIWTLIKIKKGNFYSEIWLNPLCIQEIIFDAELKIILIIMNTSEYEITCKNNFSLIQDRLSRGVISKKL